MEPKVVEAMQPLLRLIRETETGAPDPAAYGVVYGGIPLALRSKTPLTSLTVGQVLAWQRAIRARGVASTASGAYQIIYKTLLMLAPDGSERQRWKFDRRTQDEMALDLLGDAEAFLRGRTSTAAYGLALARTWASFPVLTATRGQKRSVVRGQSYYAGDGLNKALIKPEAVEAVLQECRNHFASPPAPVVPVRRNPFAALFAAIAAFFKGRKA